MGIPIILKPCRKCHIQKPLDFFARVPCRKDGRDNLCLECHKKTVIRIREERKEWEIKFI